MAERYISGCHAVAIYKCPCIAPAFPGSSAHLELKGLVHSLCTIQQGVAVGGGAAIHAACAVERGAGRLCLTGGIEDGQALRGRKVGQGAEGQQQTGDEQSATCGRLAKRLQQFAVGRQAATLTSSSSSLPTAWPRRWNWVAPAWLPPPA